MKLVLHIGAGKTGTSSIQKKLIDLQKINELDNCEYLGLFFERVKGYKVERKDAAPQFFTRMQTKDIDSLLDITKDALSFALEKYSNSGVDTLIWSNESLYGAVGFFERLIPQIQTWFDIEVVVYLRRQDKWLYSAYEQWNIKHKTYDGEYKNFDEWLSTWEKQASNEVRLKKWEEIEGINKFSVHAYDSIPNVVSHFFGEVGLNFEEEGVTERRNTKKPGAFLALHELYSSVSLNKQLPVEMNQLLKDIPIDGVNYENATMEGMSSVEMPSDILDKFEAENLRISEKYSIPFSKQHWNVEELVQKSEKSSIESILSVMLRVLLDQQARIKELESK